MRRVRIGMVKAVPEKWELAKNWEVFETQVRRCAGEGVDVFVAPECFLDGYVTPDKAWTPERFAEIAQTVGKSDFVDRLQALAESANAYIVFGLTERVEDCFYNCALVVGRKGEIVGRYCKTHLQNHDKRYAPGEDLPVFELDFGKVGIVICADRRWPESVRTLRVKGAEIILMPTYGMWSLDNEWWMRTRSYENECFVCFTHPKVALITDPKGRIAAKLQSNVPDVLVHDVDLDELTTNMLRDRRPDLYGALADPDLKFE